MSVPYRETAYGFEYGPIKVTRIASDEKKGWVVLGIEVAAKRKLQVYVSGTGRSVRVHLDGKELKA